MKKTLIHTSLLAIALGLFGNCGAGSSDSSALALAGLGGGGSGVKVATAADLAVESADDYDDNKFGLISAVTLNNWVSDWANNKPAGITGNLVIYQANKVGATSTKSIILPKSGVRVFVAADAYDAAGAKIYSWKTFRETRYNGLIAIPGSSSTASGNGVISGANIDRWFKYYSVDPTKDLIVFASGTGDNYGAIGHQNYSLRYWGVDQKHLAILNGTIKGQFDETNLGDDADGTVPTDDGTFSVKQLKNVDNRILTLSIEDTIEVVKNNGHHSVAGLSSTVYISDNRTKNSIDANPDGYTNTAGWQEFDGGENTTGTTKTSGGAVAFEGHLKGAVFVPHYNLVERVAADSVYPYAGSSTAFNTLKFKPKAAVRALWDDYSVGLKPSDSSPYTSTNNPNIGATPYVDGQTILQYCRTNTRTQTSGISTLLILGRPSVFLEDGWSIWGFLAGSFPGANFNDDVTAGASTYPSVPAAFAPDVQGVIESGARGSGLGPHYNTGVKKSTVDYFTINPTATTTKQAFVEDWNYKNQ